MDFSVARSLLALGGRFYSNAHCTYSSAPKDDFVNPGINLKLYADVVPINSGHNSLDYLIEQKIEKATHSTEAIKNNDEIDNQKGAGTSVNHDLEQSFMHPRPIKTELVLLEKKSRKRKKEQDQQSETKPTKVNHKFQFV